MIVSGRRMTTLEQTRALFRVAPVGAAMIIGGTALVLVFGVILAFDDYHIWDPWIIAGIVLWAVIGGLGQRSGAYYSAIAERAKSSIQASKPTCWRACARRRVRSRTSRSSARSSCCSST